ncbi:DNA circularization protein [Paraburkholderia sp. HD33-4]|uniref:DNA circularization protein n=1 Tax=Paraburkholderia sp. HD33-4 TaxID=2883242 RepID=UPI001F3C930B|nr:DNA circularization N-terminal domain-containing protein [Paraburkholderia sp. HD33-4]
MSAINRPFFQTLQTASWRGIPFATRGGTLRVGRRVVMHEYPYRDDVWVEDLGRAGRRISVTGFLLQDAAYGGGDVIAQRAAMIAACETPDTGDGELVHPSLGRVTASLLEFECEETTERGRSFELRFTFVEGGAQQFPSLLIATQAATGLSAVAAFAATAQDFTNRITALLQTPSLVAEIERTAQAFVNNAVTITRLGTSLVAMVANLPGQFGRYVGEFTASVGTTPASSIEQLIGAGAQARESVTLTGNTLTACAAAGDYPGMASAAQALVTAVQDSNPDPQTAVQSLLGLQNNTTPATRANATLTAGNAITTDMLRRSTVCGLADSTTNYALSSYDDAQQLRSTVSQALDTEIVNASAAGDDATYQALQALQTAVVQDLVTRGNTLATMQTVTFGASLPVLVLSQRLYQDVSRYDELVHEINPVNPAFAPASFSVPVN